MRFCRVFWTPILLSRRSCQRRWFGEPTWQARARAEHKDWMQKADQGRYPFYVRHAKKCALVVPCISMFLTMTLGGDYHPVNFYIRDRHSWSDFPVEMNIPDDLKLKIIKDDFLNQNKKKHDVVELRSGLQYKILKRVTGTPKPTVDDIVTVHYEGSLPNKYVFDSSYKRRKPSTFDLSTVMKAWQEGIPLMSEGSIFEFYIPPHLGYGESGGGNDIPARCPIIFKIKLVKIEDDSEL